MQGADNQLTAETTAATATATALTTLQSALSAFDTALTTLSSGGGVTAYSATMSDSSVASATASSSATPRYLFLLRAAARDGAANRLLGSVVGIRLQCGFPHGGYGKRRQLQREPERGRYERRRHAVAVGGRRRDQQCVGQRRRGDCVRRDGRSPSGAGAVVRPNRSGQRILAGYDPGHRRYAGLGAHRRHTVERRAGCHRVSRRSGRHRDAAGLEHLQRFRRKRHVRAGTERRRRAGDADRGERHQHHRGQCAIVRRRLQHGAERTQLAHHGRGTRVPAPHRAPWPTTPV